MSLTTTAKYTPSWLSWHRPSHWFAQGVTGPIVLYVLQPCKPPPPQASDWSESLKVPLHSGPGVRQQGSLTKMTS